MQNHDATRRRLLRGVATAGLTLGAVGTTSARSTVTYVVVGGSSGGLERGGFSVERELAGGSVRVVSGPADAEGDLAAVDGIAGVTRDFEVELADPVRESSHTGAAASDLQWDKEVTNAFEAHDVTTGSGTRIAIVDTGVDDTHPDLGNVDTGSSRSFIDGEVGPHVGDAGQHGTHVAGIAAATGEAGVTGIAPDAELVSLRVFGAEGSATFADVLAAADYAAEIGADAANMSIGTEPIPPQANADGTRVAVQRVMQSVARRGTVTTVSAGNSETDMQRGGLFTLPTSVEGVMAVSATGPNDELAFYSNYGTGEITVGAPGGGYETLEKTIDPGADVERPYPTNLVYSTIPGESYAWFAGTSMAAPQVAGLVGLVRDLDPDLNANRVESAIARGAEGTDGRGDPELGAGRIDALDTVS
ncbi:S8 family serine peptidase [Halalkalicoccus sp. NIPERK01]|uniref:S8 family peptidase n=1 Tax=Halalkalicoccus sp. NIPERK01 TaxID=3053469 RepID=UPI00256F157D|nr:S8 family serine peptidase [Halalkalicoccus sp. NIPERK01]MDL5362595.1 S8 family serine peptidase [Halalkalicoccus sp. NIPERK01]